MRYCLLVIVTVIIGACGDKDMAPTNLIHTELGILPKLISIPYDVISVKWQEPSSTERDAQNLLVLLQFSEVDALKIVENNPQMLNSSIALPRVLYENWVPALAKHSIEFEQQGENFHLKNITVLEPNSFTKTQLSPFVNGKVYALPNGYFLIDLYSM